MILYKNISILKIPPSSLYFICSIMSSEELLALLQSQFFNSSSPSNDKKRRPSLFLFKLIAIVYTCLRKWSVSLARIKIRLEFQSMEEFCQKMINESKMCVYLHKFRPGKYSRNDARSSTNVCKLFALNWLGITVPRDNFLWNGRFHLNATPTDSYSFASVGKTNCTGILSFI